ncbi:phosphatidate phosphatase LPIN2 isoform X1 [Embiotoca jacksoni]|uniref:phosphatidate phosphatase LPIN2 isoform X1 n=1 Tax=Embiotoca jacksoni TaxID=100190 RepID=UPI0037042BC5
MNIVGQLAETVFVTVKELYRGLNPATLTGGIDVIVVRQPDGSFQCSPFHVRFGKLGVLRSKEKIVDIEINGESVDMHMKLGDNGEAFFVEENENMEVPAYLCTSPIPLEIPEDTEETTEGSSITSCGAHRKKRRRKRMRSGSHLREEASSSSDERGREKECERETDQAQQESPPAAECAMALQVSKSVYYSLSEEPNEELGAMQTRDTHPHSDGEQSPSDSSVFISRPSSPKSDSELLVKSQELSWPQMEWNWGGFPMLCQPEKTPVELQGLFPSGSSHFRTIERQDSFDMGPECVISCGKFGSVTVVKPQPRTRSLDFGSHSMQSSSLSKEKKSYFARSTCSDLFKSSASSMNIDSKQTLECTLGQEENKDLFSNSVSNGTDFLPSTESTVSIEHGSNVIDSVSPGNKQRGVTVTKPNHAQKQLIKDNEDCTLPSISSNLKQQGALSEQSEPDSTTSALISEGDNGIEPCAERGEEDGVPGVTDWSAEGSPSEKTTPEDGVRDAEVSLPAAEGFPTSSEASVKAGQQDKKKGSQSPQSVGSGAMDSGTEYLSDSTSYNMDVSMSLCGQEGDTSQITKEKFMEHLVTYQDFVNNPGIIDDPSLVICINSNYYNWAVASPMVLSMTTFQKNLPTSTVEQLVKDKMPKKSGRWWFSWRRRDMDNSQQKHSKEEQEEPLASVSSTVKATLDDIDSDQAAGLGRKAILSSSLSAETLSATQSISQMYRKSLRLTSKQIEHLNLRDGANKVVFSVTTQYQGTCRCEAAIYLWNWDERVIISDIDGTITKSDALGHILPQFGKDWTHKGIAKLYHKIHQNGYKFLYCSARAIGMAAITKDYLQWVNDRGTVLPKGPVLLAPSSLFSALHREVIEKKPEVFKVACLGDIRDLFNPQRQPFYAAFGNRTNDAYAYKQVGVPETRIFTVNPKGELIQERTKGNKSSYSHLSELVEHFFPMTFVEGSTSCVLDCPEFSSFSFWKEPLPELQLDALF